MYGYWKNKRVSPDQRVTEELDMVIKTKTWR